MAYRRFRRFRRKIAVGYSVPFVLALLALSSFVLLRMLDQAQIGHGVEHSDTVIIEVKNAELNVQRIQLALRAYLLSPRKLHVTALANEQHRFARVISDLFALVADNSDQERRLLNVSNLSGTWNGSIDDLVRESASGTINAAACSPSGQDGQNGVIEEESVLGSS
jgi:CHASE3 domain sensor protein